MATHAKRVKSFASLNTVTNQFTFRGSMTPHISRLESKIFDLILVSDNYVPTLLLLPLHFVY